MGRWGPAPSTKAGSQLAAGTTSGARGPESLSLSLSANLKGAVGTPKARVPRPGSLVKAAFKGSFGG